MKRLAALAAAALCSVPTVARAQELGAVAAALKVSWTRASQNMPAAADLMPADKYGFKPTPEQMSFGEILAHEARSNETLCGAIDGAAAQPSESPAGAAASKDSLVSRLRKSFETCSGVIARLKETTLGDSVSFFGGRKATRARAVIALAQDWADHYSQAAMYLRLNGILPPTARPKP
jgi:hypothetical protein